MRLSFAYAEDALRFAELVGARTRSDGAFEFTYDRLLYDKLHAANAAKAAKQDPNLQLSFDDQFYLRALIESLRVITRATVPGEPSGDELNAFMVKRVIRASPELSDRHIVNRVGWRTDLAELEEYFQHLR